MILLLILDDKRTERSFSISDFYSTIKIVTPLVCAQVNNVEHRIAQLDQPQA